MNIERLRHLLENGELEPFIRSIRFPQYKNLAPFTTINFTYPITALVGANGTNKSSLLKALYGAPGQNNLGNLWFSTKTDPIEEGDDFPSCFVYAYLHPELKTNIEVLKTRVLKEEDPDYWEPSRPIRRYQMAAMPKYEGKDHDCWRSKTRWNPISKTVELVDFRHALSAFDRYFYYGNFSRTTTFRNKKDFIRRRANNLNEALDTQATSYGLYTKEKIINKENRILDQSELKAVCNILGREYLKIELIRHSFFNQGGYTARIKFTDLRYTEAFAGSGEFAVIRLVTTINSAQEKSLILLDEPEVSLHPGAQERLLKFIEDQVIRKKHQVIFTTHSPALIRMLPPDAVKVLAVDDLTKKIVLTAQSSHPEEAFLQIGEPLAKKVTIVVEDRLAEELIKKSLRDHHPELLKVVQSRYFPGGTSAVFQHYLQPFAAEGRTDILCLLDGDQRPDKPWPNELEISRLTDNELADTIKTLTNGNKVAFPIDSGPKEKQAAQSSKARRQYLSWCHQFVRYLPSESCPEEFILRKTGDANQTPAKKRFEQLTRNQFGLLPTESPPSDDIFSTQRQYLAKIDRNDGDIKAIADTVNQFLNDRRNE